MCIVFFPFSFFFFSYPRSISFLFYVSLQYDKELTDSISLVLELCLPFPNSCQQLHSCPLTPKLTQNCVHFALCCRQFCANLCFNANSTQLHWHSHSSRLNPEHSSPTSHRNTDPLQLEKLHYSQPVGLLPFSTCRRWHFELEQIKAEKNSRLLLSFNFCLTFAIQYTHNERKYEIKFALKILIIKANLTKRKVKGNTLFLLMNYAFYDFSQCTHPTTVEITYKFLKHRWETNFKILLQHNSTNLNVLFSLVFPQFIWFLWICYNSPQPWWPGDAPRRGQKTVDSHSRLFGEPTRPITPGKNHMKSSIPFGQNTEAVAAQKLLTTNGHYNGKSGSVSSASSSVSSSTENLKMNSGSRSGEKRLALTWAGK